MDVKEWLGADNQIGQDIWYGKYQYNNESFDEWLDRISDGDEELKEEIKAKRFLFGGRILANRGLYKDGVKVTYSNCYVLPAPKDNIESIYEAASRLARTFSYGGGVGIDLSNLAPRGARVNNTAKTTSGAVSFMDLYSMTTSLIGQNGRRGALMLSLDCHHPDLEEFINVKSDLDKVTTANISVKVTDDFMAAAVTNQPFKLSHWRDEVQEEIAKEVNANDILDKLAFQNWDMGEPGMLFWDTINNWNLVSEDPKFEYAGTNPCAEEPLPPGGSCLLGSINLSEFVDHPYTNMASFDKHKFMKTVAVAVNALNDVLDEGLPLHPLAIQRDAVRAWRQIGLGIFGLADMLVKLGIQYGSEQSLMVCEDVGRTLARTAITTSYMLAKKYGAYPACDKEKLAESPYLKSLFGKEELNEIKEIGLYNSQILTIAPTGTLSTMLQVSGGVEPYYAMSWTRTTKSLHGEDVDYIERPKALSELLTVIGGKSDDDFPEYVITSSKIKPVDRIYMQAKWQQFIDASISSTVNLPNSATVDDVKRIYIEAWKNDLKGITVFRDGCRRVGILSTDDDEKADVENNANLRRGDIINVSDDLIGYKRKIINGCGDFQEQIFFDDFTGEPLENYIAMGDDGGCAKNLEAISRLISLCLRSGVDVTEIIKQLKKVRQCPAYKVRRIKKGDVSPGTSCPSAIGCAMEELCAKIKDRCFADEDEESLIDPNSEDGFQAFMQIGVDDGTKAICPDCGEKLIFEGGCNICKSCGYSKCG